MFFSNGAGCELVACKGVLPADDFINKEEPKEPSSFTKIYKSRKLTLRRSHVIKNLRLYSLLLIMVMNSSSSSLVPVQNNSTSSIYRCHEANGGSRLIKK